MWDDGDAGEPLLADAEPALHRRVAVSGPQRPAVGGRRGEVPGVDMGCGVGRAVMGVVPLLIFFHEASINTFLDPALHFFNLFLWSGTGTTPHSRLFKFRFQFQVHLDQFFTREGGRQGAEYLLIG